jgi:hypothetical protein
MCTESPSVQLAEKELTSRQGVKEMRGVSRDSVQTFVAFQLLQSMDPLPLSRGSLPVLLDRFLCLQSSQLTSAQHVANETSVDSVSSARLLHVRRWLGREL